MRVSSMVGLGMVVIYAQGSRADEKQWLRAIEVPQVSRRQEYQGGWPMGLSGSTCPTGLVQCRGSISNPSCCPTGSGCYGLGAEHCCPANVDCEDYVTNFPQCADPNNVLYMLDSRGSDYFCCPPGQIGVLPISNYGGFCQPEGAAVAASRIAVKASEAMTTLTTTTRTSGTATILTTARDGVVSTITTITTGRVTVTRTTGLLNPTNVPNGADNSVTPTTRGTSSTSTPSNQNDGSSSGGGGPSISAGAIAGIVIGALAVLAIFALAFVLYRRHRPAPISHPSPTAGPGPAPDYTAYAPPTHQQQDMSTYPIPVTGLKSPVVSQSGVGSTVGGQSPGQGTISPQHSGYGMYGGPPPPADAVAEVQGQNSWEGRAEMGSGR